MKGNSPPWTEERREAASLRMRGRKPSEESRRKMSESATNRPLSYATRLKISATKKRKYQMDSLGEALPREMARVRDVVMPIYREIGPGGAIALSFMRRDLDLAARALAEGDVAAMIVVYQSLKEYTL